MISIVVPAYNEEAVIEDLVKAVAKARIEKTENYELVIVDDGSADRTAGIVKKLSKKNKRIVLVSYKPNKGLGGALKEGIKASRGNVIVTMDSDLTHPPALIPKLVEEMRRTNADVCVASRYVRGGGMKNIPAVRVWLSKSANLVLSVLFPLKDVSSGFKAYRADKIKNLKLTHDDFSFQLEIMAKLAKRKAKFYEIPFVLKSREKGESKFSPESYLKYIPSLMEIVSYRLFR
jgi:dolichol-phosphate mannosyltransferase